jgi:hypothetical protein
VDPDVRHWSIVEISGTLSLSGPAGKTLRLVDWYLPLRVVLCPRPDQQPDWSKLHELRNAVWADVFVGRERIYGWRTLADRTIEPVLRGVSPAGVFTATFPLSDIQGPTGPMKRFQLGLCLGLNEGGKRVTWRNTAPVLPQTVQMIEIPAATLSRTLQLINACPTPIGWNYDPIALVRAANHLRSLGKEKAIAALREFLDLAYDRGYGRHRIDPADIETSNQWCLASLVPLVFDNLRTGGKIKVWEGIPFHTVRIHEASGWPEFTGPLVEEAAQKGRLREKPLHPADNPLEAADRLFEKIATPKDRKRGTDSGGLHYHLREQAWRAVGHLLDPSGARSPDVGSQAIWDDLKARAVRLTLRWDVERQEYRVAARD